MQTKKVAATANVGEMDINAIMARIPHRYPMLMIDRVIDIVPGVSATGIKNVTANEPFFQGHFPSRPIMPGVLIVEAMAQTAGTVVVDYMLGTNGSNDLVYFMTIENARFRHPVVPGDTLQLRVKKLRERGNVWRFSGEAYVGDLLCAEATYTAMLVRGEAAMGAAPGAA
ncbi:MAG: 3-hydroxyacyl-ACP dehydratase FabZ [Alphaproteobacteria bacterium]|nr:3-hydroxyacyl-ACP dehydratase FabZ [Alphaproteobacteria bacterium]